MSALPWRIVLGLPIVAALIVVAVAATAGVGQTAAALGQAAGTAAPRTPAPRAVPRAADLERCPSRPAGRQRSGPVRGTAWVRLDPLLDARGALAGQRLTIGILGGPPVATVDLAAEAFAAAPFQGRVLVGSDDGRRSTLRIVDAAMGCIAATLESRGLVRRALLDPARDAVVEFRLERTTRADEGIWIRPLDDGLGRRIAAPLPSNGRIGRVFSTELAWSAAGDRLVVTSCGEAACLIRVVDPAGGGEVTIDDPRIGESIGLVGSTLVAYAGCPALPCDVVSHDLASGRTRIVARLAGLATLAAGDGEPRLVVEDRASGDLAIVGLDGARLGRVAAPSELRLVPAAHRAWGAVEAPAGLVALGVAGRPGPDGVLLGLTERDVVPAGEALP